MALKKRITSFGGPKDGRRPPVAVSGYRPPTLISRPGARPGKPPANSSNPTPGTGPAEGRTNGNRPPMAFPSTVGRGQNTRGERFGNPVRAAAALERRRIRQAYGITDVREASKEQLAKARAAGVLPGAVLRKKMKDKKALVGRARDAANPGLRDRIERRNRRTNRLAAESLEDRRKARREAKKKAERKKRRAGLIRGMAGTKVESRY